MIIYLRKDKHRNYTNYCILATQEDTDNKEHTHRGIYLYNAKSKNIELLFETDEEYINNFVVLNE